MCYMEQCSDRTAHSMDNGNRCIVKCDSCLKSSDRHLYTGFFILSVFVCNRKIFKDPLYCRYCKSIGKCLCFSGCISFHTVAKCIKTCCCCDLWRCSHSKLRVDNGKIRHENFAFKKHLDVFFGIRDNRELCCLRSRSCCGRDRRHWRHLYIDHFSHVVGNASTVYYQ